MNNITKISVLIRPNSETLSHFGCADRDTGLDAILVSSDGDESNGRMSQNN